MCVLVSKCNDVLITSLLNCRISYSSANDLRRKHGTVCHQHIFIYKYQREHTTDIHVKCPGMAGFLCQLNKQYALSPDEANVINLNLEWVS